MNSSIKLCIDVARVFNERTGKKDARFYQQDWLARTCGIYRKPHYPKQLEYACTSVIEALWKQYKPASEDFCESAALLASWLSILYPDTAPLSGDIVSRYNYLVVSESIDVYDANGNTKQQMRLRAENTKANEMRTVFLNEKLIKEAEKYAATLKHFQPNKPLLQTQKRTAFSANTLCQRFKELYVKAGIDGASSHSGRRWFITQLAHKGVSAKVVMTLAGHKHLATTQRYIEVNDEMLKAAVEIL